MKHVAAVVFSALGLASLAGCASSQTVPTGSTTVTAAQMPVAQAQSEAATPPSAAEAAAPALTRDADLKGDEQKVSLLEGKLTLKIHATEAPKVTTGTTPKGLMYSTLEAKLGDGQTVHCAAYADVIWPAGVVASDLRGEHDWADNGSEVPDAKGKTHAEVTSFDVFNINGTPALTARAVVRDGSKNIVAQRKIAVLSGPTSTLLCSDRTIGYSSRFGKFAGEAFASSHIDPAPTPANKTSLYKIFDLDGKTVIGYRQVASYNGDKGTTKTFSDEARLNWLNADGSSTISSEDSLTSSVMNAKGEETEIHYDAAVDGVAVGSSAITRDARGNYKLVTGLGESSLKMKSAPLDAFGPAWTSRVRTVAARPAKPAKVALFTPKGAVSATMKRTGDGAVAIAGPGGETPVALDNEGVVSMTLSGRQYKRVSVSNQ